MCLRCFALMCKLTWDFYYNSSWHQTFYNAYPLKIEVVVIQNLVSVCTLKQNIGATLCGFTIIKLDRTMYRSDWKCSPVHTYRLNQSKWTFSLKYQKVGIVFSQGGRMDYLAWLWLINPNAHKRVVLIMKMPMGLLPDTKNCGLRMCRECTNMHHGTCATHVPWCMPG